MKGSESIGMDDDEEKGSGECLRTLHGDPFRTAHLVLCHAVSTAFNVCIAVAVSGHGPRKQVLVVIIGCLQPSTLVVYHFI